MIRNTKMDKNASNHHKSNTSSFDNGYDGYIKTTRGRIEDRIANAMLNTPAPVGNRPVNIDSNTRNSILSANSSEQKKGSIIQSSLLKPVPTAENKFESRIFATYELFRKEENKLNRLYEDSVVEEDVHEKQMIEDLKQKEIQEERKEMQRKLQKAEEERLKNQQHKELKRQQLIQENRLKEQKRKFHEEKIKLQLKQEEEQCILKKGEEDKNATNTIHNVKGLPNKVISSTKEATIDKKTQQELIKKQEVEHEKQLLALNKAQEQEEERQKKELEQETEKKQLQQQIEMEKQNKEHELQNIHQKMLNDQQDANRKLLRKKNNEIGNSKLLKTPRIQGSCSVTYLNRLATNSSDATMERKKKTIG